MANGAGTAGDNLGRARFLPHGRFVANEGIQPSTEPLAKMCELQDTLARVGEPQTVLGARELLGIAIKMLSYRIESPESTVAQGPVVQLIRNVNEALKWLDGDTRLCPPSRSDKTDTGTKARTDRAGSFELFRSADSEQTGRFPVATASICGHALVCCRCNRPQCRPWSFAAAYTADTSLGPTGKSARLAGGGGPCAPAVSPLARLLQPHIRSADASAFFPYCRECSSPNPNLRPCRSEAPCPVSNRP
jgi:hypothetical protein